MCVIRKEFVYLFILKHFKCLHFFFFLEPRHTTNEHKIELNKIQNNLTAGQAYIISIGIVGPVGFGPLSDTPVLQNTACSKTTTNIQKSGLVSMSTITVWIFIVIIIVLAGIVIHRYKQRRHPLNFSYNRETSELLMTNEIPTNLNDYTPLDRNIID